MFLFGRNSTRSRLWVPPQIYPGPGDNPEHQANFTPTFPQMDPRPSQIRRTQLDPKRPNSTSKPPRTVPNPESAQIPNRARIHPNRPPNGPNSTPLSLRVHCASTPKRPPHRSGPPQKMCKFEGGSEEMPCSMPPVSSAVAAKHGHTTRLAREVRTRNSSLRESRPPRVPQSSPSSSAPGSSSGVRGVPRVLSPLRMVAKRWP